MSDAKPGFSLPMDGSADSAVSVLRRFVRKPQPLERCELCGAGIRSVHPHLFDPAHRQVMCSCDACSILFDTPTGTKYRKVPRRLLALTDFQMPDLLWTGFAIPVSMAFLCTTTTTEGPVAFYPSPAGAAEAFIPPDSWDELLAQNPVLRDMEPDVEALLVNRTSGARGYYLAPIDTCYELVGITRYFWQGLSGGHEVWQRITLFFEGLDARATTRRRSDGA